MIFTISLFKKKLFLMKKSYLFVKQIII